MLNIQFEVGSWRLTSRNRRFFMVLERELFLCTCMICHKYQLCSWCFASGCMRHSLYPFKSSTSKRTPHCLFIVAPYSLFENSIELTKLYMLISFSSFKCYCSTCFFWVNVVLGGLGRGCPVSFSRCATASAWHTCRRLNEPYYKGLRGSHDCAENIPSVSAYSIAEITYTFRPLLVL